MAINYRSFVRTCGRKKSSFVLFTFFGETFLMNGTYLICFFLHKIGRSYVRRVSSVSTHRVEFEIPVFSHRFRQKFIYTFTGCDRRLEIVIHSTCIESWCHSKRSLQFVLFKNLRQFSFNERIECTIVLWYFEFLKQFTNW